MSLFDKIISAIENPEQQASSSQLSSILNTVQQLTSSNQANSDTMQSAMSIVGNFTRSALQSKRDLDGEEEVEKVIDRYAGTNPNPQVLQALFTTPQVLEMTQQITKKTGLNPQLIQGLLPTLVPLVLNFLKTGSKMGNIAGNPVLSSFLDADGDGDVDVADAMILASRYLGK